MKQQITFSQFQDGFSCRPDNFTYNGLASLYEWFEQMEEDCGSEITFDPIAICCEFCEYSDLAEFQADYGDVYQDEDDIHQATILIMLGSGLDDGFIIQSF